jgi:hypothetical protein
MRQESASQSHLTLYTYAEGKYNEAGCYIAHWPGAKDGEIQDPEITPCKSEQPAKSEPPASSEAPAKSNASSESERPAASQPPAAQPPAESQEPSKSPN